MRLMVVCVAVAMLAGCASPGSAEAAAANAYQKEQLRRVQKGLREKVSSYDRDLRDAYQAHADSILETELLKASQDGMIPVARVPELLTQSRAALKARFDALDVNLERFSEDENLEDAILLNDAEGAWIRAVDAAWADVQRLIGQFSRKGGQP